MTLFMGLRVGLIQLRNQYYRSCLSIFAVVFICAGCSSIPQPFYTQAESYKKVFSQTNGTLSRHTYILQFSNSGRLINFGTLFQAVSDIQSSFTNSPYPITNVVVMSYGWSHDIDTGELDYYSLLSNYDEYISKLPEADRGPFRQTAVICVSWHSDTSAFATSLGDLIPSPTFSQMIATPVSMLTFPVSVWSKTAVADKIGYEDLKRSLNYLYEQCYTNSYGLTHQPNIFLVGHSFGCRILSGAIRTNLPPKLPFSPFQLAHKPAKSFYPEKAMKFLPHIKGGIFIEPALTEGNLPEKTDFPLLVIQSRHDHLNSLLFPIASIPFNAYISSEMQTTSDNWEFGNSTAPTATDYYFKQPVLHDLPILLRIVPYSVLAWPGSYLAGQWQELSNKDNWNWRTNYITDTLAQLPVIDVVMQEVVGNKTYHKGAFNLGKWNESAARISVQSPQPLDSFAITNSGKAYLDTTNGIQFVNAQKVVSESVYTTNIDYDVPFFTAPFEHIGAGTVGWLDPVGSHDDYEPHANSKDVQIFDLIHLLMSGRIKD